jgi:hypothetical protein
MATLPTHEEKAATTHGDQGADHRAAIANDKRAAAAPLTPAGINLLIALLAADWVVGDKHHYALIRKQTLKLLGDLGADGAEAKARLEGMSGVAPPVTAPPTAKAA